MTKYDQIIDILRGEDVTHSVGLLEAIKMDLLLNTGTVTLNGKLKEVENKDDWICTYCTGTKKSHSALCISQSMQHHFVPPQLLK